MSIKTTFFSLLLVFEKANEPETSNNRQSSSTTLLHYTIFLVKFVFHCRSSEGACNFKLKIFLQMTRERSNRETRGKLTRCNLWNVIKCNFELINLWIIGGEMRSGLCREISKETRSLCGTRVWEVIILVFSAHLFINILNANFISQFFLAVPRGYFIFYSFFCDNHSLNLSTFRAGDVIWKILIW